jgi:predicted nucleotidyltransferase component of viral defense system
MIAPAFRAQADLLLRILPYVATEETLALKGGTAINLFVRDMPRLSVDIDLTYLPFDERASALRNISAALGRIRQGLEAHIPGIRVSPSQWREGQDARIVCQLQQALVKVEVNTTLRGHLWPVRQMQLAWAAQDEFGKFAAVQVVSQAELFGGKVCAAFDRQHPRDLFDAHQLFAHEGLTDDIHQGFIVALLSHPRSIHEVIRPRLQDQRSLFATQFTGMTSQQFTYDDFEATRERLVREVHERLTDGDRSLLLSFKQGEPDWGLFPIGDLRELPAIRWKLDNIRRLKRQNPNKHARQLEALREALSIR